MRSFLLLFALAAAGCGGKVVVDPAGPVTPTCAQVCAEVLAVCINEGTDCATSCAQVDAIQAAGGCKEVIDTYFVCADQNPSGVCSPVDPCAADAQALQSCLTTFCTQNPAVCAAGI
jgi:hypothetical protein